MMQGIVTHGKASCLSQRQPGGCPMRCVGWKLGGLVVGVDLKCRERVFWLGAMSGKANVVTPVRCTTLAKPQSPGTRNRIVRLDGVFVIGNARPTRALSIFKQPANSPKLRSQI
jgi:hypothetical protein